MLNLKQLNYFVAAARHGSFSKAALHVHISKSAVVRAVDLLEEQYRTKLFFRQRAKGIVVTQDGQTLLHMCETLFQDMRDLEARLFDANTVSGELVLTCLESLAACIVPYLAVMMRKSYPSLKLRTIEAYPEHALDLLRQGEAHVIISVRSRVGSVQLPKWLEYEVLMHPVPCITLAASHPLARKRTVTLQDLLGYPMITMSQPYITQLSLAYFQQIDRFPEIACETNTIESLRALISKGMGFGMTHFRPKVDRSFTGDRLVTRPVSGVTPNVEIFIGYVRRNEYWTPPKVKAFLEKTREHFSSSLCAEHFVAEGGVKKVSK